LISALHHEKDKTTYITQVTPTLHDAINIVYHADNMSSMERNKKDEDEEKNHHVKTTPMTSIFEVIFGQQEQG
jgi:CRISPR/Cas system-associated protein Cas10 (large subunit of type III CRISPR-Cas system)